MKIRFAKPKLPPESCFSAATQRVRGSDVKSNENQATVLSYHVWACSVKNVCGKIQGNCSVQAEALAAEAVKT